MLLARKRKGQSGEEGLEAVWWSRFPIGGDDQLFQRALQYDRHWDDCFRGRNAVSLCVYIVCDLPRESRDQREHDLRARSRRLGDCAILARSKHGRTHRWRPSASAGWP
jgi:hypothetical protein